jgi:hypothetical protein
VKETVANVDVSDEDITVLSVEVEDVIIGET